MTYTEDEIRLSESSPVPLWRRIQAAGRKARGIPSLTDNVEVLAAGFEPAPQLLGPVTWDVTMVPVPGNMFWEREALERIRINVPDHTLWMHARLNRRFRLVQQGNALHLTPAPLNEADFEDGGPVVLPVNPGDLIKIRGEGSVYEAKLRDRFLQFNRIAGISPNEDLTAA